MSGKVIYWHTCGLREVYDHDASSDDAKTGDITTCSEMGCSPEGTPCIVFKEVVA